jgi:hypothetical protein
MLTVLKILLAWEGAGNWQETVGYDFYMVWPVKPPLQTPNQC